MSLDLLPKMVQFQLCATMGLTGIAGIPKNVLRLGQLLDCRKGHSEHITLQAADAWRYVAEANL